MTVVADSVAQDIIFEGLLLMVLSIMIKTSSSKKHTQFKTRVQHHTLFMIKTVEKPYPFGLHIPI